MEKEPNCSAQKHIWEDISNESWNKFREPQTIIFPKFKCTQCGLVKEEVKVFQYKLPA